MKITRDSTDATPGPSDWFTGVVYIDAVATPSELSRLAASSVRSAMPAPLSFPGMIQRCFTPVQ